MSEERNVQVVIAEGVVVRPGDTLVVILPPDTVHDQFPGAHEYWKAIQASMPEGAKAVVLEMDGAMAVVRGKG